MAFEKVTDGSGWNGDVLRKGGGFLQSWEWGEFQRALGREVVRLRDGGTMVQAVRMPLPFGKSYWYVPRGPVGGGIGAPLAGGIFTRFEPSSVPEKAKKVPSVQPSQTVILDLAGSEEELLSAMHEKTRYNIRLAERKGVRVMPGPGSEDGFITFRELVKETSERAGIRSHDEDHYRRMLDALSGDMASEGEASSKLMFAEHDGKVLAAILLIRFGGTVTYLHGASSRDRKELMSPYLLHWEAIRQAKTWGAKAYDFWGVAPMEERDGKLRMKDSGHPWAGITRFKKGFGGDYVEYPGTFDLPGNRFWYTLYSVARRLRGRS